MKKEEAHKPYTSSVSEKHSMETRGLRKKSFNYELIILYFGIQKRNNKTWEHTCAVINRRTRHRQGERNYAICMKEQVSYTMLAKVKLNSHMMSKHATLATRFSLRLKEACDRQTLCRPEEPWMQPCFFFLFFFWRGVHCAADHIHDVFFSSRHVQAMS